jgi:hypothetical protein
MGLGLSVSVKLLLTTGGEHIYVTGSGNRATVSFPSLASGVRHLRGFLERPELVQRLKWFDSAMDYFGLSLYVKLGPFVLPILGVKSNRMTLRMLSFLGTMETRYKAVSRMELR